MSFDDTDGSSRLDSATVVVVVVVAAAAAAAAADDDSVWDCEMNRWMDGWMGG